MIDLLVLGSGVAGLSAAIRGATAGLDTVLVTKGELGLSTTRYAQGGVAAALTPEDSPELHRSDTLSAGAGLCDPDAVGVLVSDGPQRVRDLIDMGAVFDTTGSGEAAALALAREGGHSLARVVHAGGDATGVEIERALVAALIAAGVEVLEGWFAVDLIVDDGRAAGLRLLDPAGHLVERRARHTVLASGGAGQLYAVTTNPEPATGDGTAMALRAGVPVADLEFVQFHPTALAHERMPRALLSEALRGEGAVLRDAEGRAFMADEHPLADLAPRDVVARAIATRIAARSDGHVWLDATSIGDFARRFPTIHTHCREAGLDPEREWLPVAPAAHYHCGGIVTDLDGAAALPGLWAVGEAACTGAHGANRLASNSLLEGLVFAARAIGAVAAGRDGPTDTGALRGVDVGTRATPVAAADPGARDAVQRAMTEGAGVLRSEASLEATLERLADVDAGPAGDPRSWEAANLVGVGSAVCRAAIARRESRGAHTREDRPDTRADLLGRFVHHGPDVEFVPLARSDASVG